MAGIAALAGAGASIYGALNSSDTASGVQLPPQFQMPGMGQAASGALTGIQNMPFTGAGAKTEPLSWQSAMGLYNNPGAGSLVQGAQGAQGLGQNAALGQYGAGGALTGAGLEALPYARTLMQMGFDPQQALYQRTANQLQNQTLANLSNAGIATSPYGQGVLGGTMGNFNIDWQNQALARALQGAQGAGGLINMGGASIGQGTGLQTSAAGNYGQFAGLPYAAYSGLGKDQLAALSGYQGVGAGAQGLAQTQIQDYLNYLGHGAQQQNANTATAGVGLKQAELGFNQNQMLGQNFGAGMYGAGNAYNKGFPGVQQGLGWLGNIGQPQFSPQTFNTLPMGQGGIGHA